MSNNRSHERYRKRRNRGLQSLGGGVLAIFLGGGVVLGAIAADEFLGWSGARRFSGHIGVLFALGGLVGIIAGFADVLWAWVDDRPKRAPGEPSYFTHGPDCGCASCWYQRGGKVMTQPQPNHCPRHNPKEQATPLKEQATPLDDDAPPSVMVGHIHGCTCVDCSYRAGVGYYRRTFGRKFDYWRHRAKPPHGWDN